MAFFRYLCPYLHEIITEKLLPKPLRMNIIKGIGSLLWRHKTLIIIAFLAVYLVVLDENAYMVQRMKNEQIERMEAELAGLKQQFEADTRELDELDSLPELTVRIAREQYKMKRPDEDIFVFESTLPNR